MHSQTRGQGAAVHLVGPLATAGVPHEVYQHVDPLLVDHMRPLPRGGAAVEARSDAGPNADIMRNEWLKGRTQDEALHYQALND